MTDNTLKSKIYYILKTYNIEIRDGVYNYSNLIENIVCIVDDHNESNKFINIKYNGLKCLGVFFLKKE